MVVSIIGALSNHVGKRMEAVRYITDFEGVKGKQYVLDSYCNPKVTRFGKIGR